MASSPPLCNVWLTKENVILQRDAQSLWCSLVDGSFLPGGVLDMASLDPQQLLYQAYGVVGKMRLLADSEWKLLVITHARCIGQLPPSGGTVYCIEKVSMITLSVEKSAEEIRMEAYSQDRREKELKERDKLERRLTEALLQMLNGSNSFYFSYDTDLTQSVQRKSNCGDASRMRHWKRVDERFFWNKEMIHELFDEEVFGVDSDQWVLPVIQGFVDIRQLPIPSPSHLGIFNSTLTTRGSHDKSGSFSSDQYSKSNSSKNTTAESVTVDVRSYTFVDKVGESVIAREYTPVIDGYLDSELNEVMPGNVSEVVDKQEGSDVDTEVCVDPESSLASDVSNKTVEKIGPGDQAGGDDLERSTTGARSPSSDVVTSDHPSTQFLTVNTTDLLAKRREQSKEHSLTESDVLCSARTAVANDSSHFDDSWDTDEAADNRYSTASFQPEINGSLEMRELVADGDYDEAGKQDREKTPMPPQEEDASERAREALPTITMALISRRSRHRAGTRYLRRGVDEHGHVGNFVETEMILQVASQVLAFMIVRGSVPVYWTQPGHKYKPIPIIQRDDEETKTAFEKHFEEEINLYQQQVIVNLVNQRGREEILAKAFEKHLLILDCPELTYVSFDFHHHCKASQWHNISLLLDKIEPYITKHRYYWEDIVNGTSPLCVQCGVFRINCMDCLDRTNVVQSVICKEIIQTALQKLGLLSPFQPIKGTFLRQYQEIWANNGDIISRQYTGTGAMKSDLTRYGERRLYGVMKDGYNSAHRYYQSIFRDAYRQVVIDEMQGCSPSDAISSLPQSALRGSSDLEEHFQPLPNRPVHSLTTNKEEAIMEMIEVCKKELYPFPTDIDIQGWALVEAAGYSFVQSSQKDEDTVLLLCTERRHICVVNFLAEHGLVACCIRIPLERIDRITIGPIGTLLRSSRRLYMRLRYTLFPGRPCYFTFRTVQCVSLEEDRAMLLNLAQQLSSLQPNIAVHEQKLSKQRSPPHEGLVYLISPEDSSLTEAQRDVVAKRGAVSATNPFVTSNDWERLENLNDMEMTTLSPYKTWARLGHHSRGSSLASSVVVGDRLEMESVASSQDEDGEKCFSAPGSPTLDRRISMLSLDERSRLLSHSSLDDLSSPLSGEVPDVDWDISPSKSYQYYNDPGVEQPYQLMAASDSEDEEEEEIEVSHVLEQTHIHRSHSLEANPQLCDEVAPMCSMDSNKPSELMAEEELDTTEPKNISAPKSEVLSSDSEDDQDLLQETNTSSKDINSSQGLGFSITRLTGRFLRKVRSGSASSKLVAVPDAPSQFHDKLEKSGRSGSGSVDLKQNVRQLLKTIGVPGGGGRNSTSDTGDTKLAESFSERQQWVEKCQKTSRTKFIFI